MSDPGSGRASRLLVPLAKAPHVGKAGLALLAVLLAADVWAEVTGRVDFITAGFLAFAALTATLFLLCLYDLAVTILRLRYRPTGAGAGAVPEPFRIGSDVLVEYARWLSPVGFVVGIIVGHYFWQ